MNRIKDCLIFFTYILLFPTTSRATTFRTCIQDFYPKGMQERGRVQGYSVDIIRALQDIDKKIEFTGYDQLCTFPKIEADLQSGKLDVFISAFKTPEREKKFYFIDIPIYIMRFMMVVRRNDSTKVKTFDDIRGKSDNVILTLHGTAMQMILERDPGLNLDASASLVEENLKKLESGKGRFLFLVDLGLQHTLNEPPWRGKFRILPAVFGAQGQYVMVSRKLSGKDIELLQHALSSLRNSGKLDEIFRHY
ncbi:MAG TPA: transporter substrate-binding domain-containing protein [Bdellovibrio sp.]|uniref:substrate-binding periplasmic protein n=1 Tax=Bdellovibrio sp. TaxID=28201 RepID=UPI002F0A7AFE